MPGKIKIGSTVKLKCGTTTMMVESYAKKELEPGDRGYELQMFRPLEDDPTRVVCVWDDSYKRIHRDTFNIAVLELVKDQ